MALWKKGNSESADVKKSAELCKRRDQLEAKLPEVQAAWAKVNAEEVEPAAARLSVVQLMQDAEQILEASEVLRRAIWKRTSIKGEHSRVLGELNAEIEMLNGSVIFEKVTQWQKELLDLREHRIVEAAEKFVDMGQERLPHMILLRSNFAAVDEARKGLQNAICTLRDMRSRPLGEVLKFVESVEEKLQKIDLTKLETAKEPISETAYHDVIARPEMQVRPRPGETDRMAERFFRADHLTRA